MDLNRPKSIDEWFESADDDTDFVCEERAFPYSVIGPVNASSTVIFTTKPACVLSSVRTHPEFATIALVGRSGLPSAEDLNWFRDLVGQRRLLFLGDMDPVDLMVFAWLRENLKPSDIGHLGVSDSYIQKLHVQLPDNFIMSCTPTEISSLSLLEEVFSDFREVIGHECTKLLDAGRKIELEAVASALGDSAPLLSPTFLGQEKDGPNKSRKVF